MIILGFGLSRCKKFICKWFSLCKWPLKVVQKLQVVDIAESGRCLWLAATGKGTSGYFKLQVPSTSEPSVLKLGGLYRLASCMLICCKCSCTRQDRKNKKLCVRIQQAWELNFKNLDLLLAHISKLKKTDFEFSSNE